MCEGNLLKCTDLGTSSLIYIEYGAGKAGLSSFVAAKLADLHTEAPFEKSKVLFLVVDRESRRFTKDNQIKKVDFEVERQKVDIADFDLVKYASLRGDSKPKVIGIAKHLCGGATDLALTSFNKLAEGQLDGLSMATCCHHCCDTKTYVNLPFIVSEVGIPEHQFNVFVKCSSWAVGPFMSSEKRKLGFKLKRILDLGRLLFVR